MKPLAIITGASRGIGLAIAEKFAQSGFDLAICARNLTTLLDLKAKWEAQYKAQVWVHSVDVSRKEEVKTFANEVLALNRPIGVLVNNAGVFLGGQMHTEPDGTLETLIETNLYSAYYLTKALTEIFIQQKRGHIFNICSVASQIAYPHGGSYSVSKFALLGFSKSLREELKPKGVRVTAIVLGATLTDSWAGVDLPAERFVKASDVADSLWSIYQLSENTVIEEILIRPQLGDI